MFRKPLTTRAGARSGIGSKFALAIALASGTVLTVGAIATPAQAQRQRQKAEGETLSRAFQPLYQQVADATNAGGDLTAAKAQVPAMVAAIGSEYDRFFAGNVLLQLGSKASDKALQRQGLELMVASGRADPANLGLFRYFLSGFAYDAGDYAGALREAQASLAAGFTGNFAEQQDPWLLVADSHFKLGQNAEGLAFLKNTIEQRLAAGQPVRDQWLTRALAVAYQQKMATEAGELSALLVKTNPTQTNWTQALQVVSALMQSDVQARLDVLRLMHLTGALSQRGEFESYVDVLDPRVLPTEAGRILEAGVQKGVFTTSDPFYTERKRIVDTRMSAEAGLAADYAGDAASASDGKPAFNAGDVYLSLGQYAKAEAMFALALQKGGVDRDQTLTRLGIAQVQQGKNAEAKGTFAQVSGTRTAVARMWTAYADSRA
jgi:tetratricopeptide (TPR) repeat protein